jgi:phage tail sheath protein FI
MTSSPRLPAVRFEVRAPAPPVTPLRTDVAGFIGRTLRGPVGECVRVDGWRQYQEIFGGLSANADMPLAARGYFENGGEVAYFVRLLGTPSSHAVGRWTVGSVDTATAMWDASAPAGGRFEATEFEILAATPGTWANGLRVLMQYRYRGQEGTPEVDIRIDSPLEGTEYLLGLPPDDLVAAVAARSRLIRLRPATLAPAPGGAIGPRTMVWPQAVLGHAIETPAGYADYVAAANLLALQREVAIMAAPDLSNLAGDDAQRTGVFTLMVSLAEATHDRQFIGDVPPDLERPSEVLAWLKEQRAGLEEEFPRSVALYHPRLRVIDPLGGVAAPLRDVSPVGHVAGVVSRLDRVRGAHHTPANAPLFDAVDLSVVYDADEQGALAMGGVNPVRCAPNQGLVVWGGRTAFDPALGSAGLFLAHRRLIHRLVRAIRRVAEPLVFEVNGPDLWLALVRAITSVLLEAWRAGALKGERAEQAFLVRCDDTTNPPESEDAGQVLCEVRVAPAMPMEFITLRIAVSREGRLEVIET